MKGWPIAYHIGCVRQTELWLDSSWLLVLPFLAWSLAVHYFPRTYPVFTPTVAWLLGIASAVASLGLVLLHEAVHLGLNSIRGRPPGRVVIFVVGHAVCASNEGKGAIVVSVCGPAASLVLAILAFWAALNVGPLSRPLEALFGYLAGASALIAFVHLLPAWPLDGGHALYALLIAAGVNRPLANTAPAAAGLAAGICMIGVALWASSSVLTATWLSLIGVLILLSNSSRLVELRDLQGEGSPLDYTSRGG